MEFNYNDGGRSKYFKAERVGDCVVRAIAIATKRDYKEVYKETAKFLGYTPRNGVLNKDTKRLVPHFGGIWVPCMGIGTGCKVHLSKDELPKGTIIVNVSHHLSCVINGVINDTYDCSRNGERCVYGYWKFEESKPATIKDKISQIQEEMPRDAMLGNPRYIYAVLDALIESVEQLENKLN